MSYGATLARCSRAVSLRFTLQARISVSISVMAEDDDGSARSSSAKYYYHETV